ncbi:ATP-binding protein [Sporosarcina thermotolerans]|uniref:ATP-binding protein n=1 Tax=Sporosarcina thermotolerans TaxID=633404 RepID=UPI003D2F64C1
MKYSEDGEIITIISEEDSNEVRLKIKDQGIGIPDQDIGRVFELGFTGTNGRINSKSTGIGLYIAKKIIDKIGHGVTISTVNMYTVITVHFPKGDDYYAIVNETGKASPSRLFMNSQVCLQLQRSFGNKGHINMYTQRR